MTYHHVKTVSVESLFDTLLDIANHDGELLSMWGADHQLHCFFVFWNEGTCWIKCPLSTTDPAFPDLSKIFPVASRLQRAITDLHGFKVMGAQDNRPWLKHGDPDQYEFISVAGEGVHQIPVGPVHAGIIEPGHFRFHVVGEHVLRLEERLGYTHKGIGTLFSGCTFEKGLKIAGRISGDSTVAYAWAYCEALEKCHEQVISPRALWLRALLLERERMMNHLGDLGALGNDAGFHFAFTQFMRLKEDMLRINQQLFGHRYLMDAIVPGGVLMDLGSSGIKLILDEIEELTKEVETLRLIYRDHGGLQDRFVSTGILQLATAKHLSVLGMAGRASGREVDWRTSFGIEPFNSLHLYMMIEKEGDVASRVSIRFREVEESLRICRDILNALPDGEVYSHLPLISQTREAYGCVEGWRGPVFVALSNQDDKHLKWAHAHDPSWQNWPALEYAVLDNIVPDFPLINKSFNLSYSGHDG